jgi:hypothetical protein
MAKMTGIGGVFFKSTGDSSCTGRISAYVSPLRRDPEVELAQ